MDGIEIELKGLQETSGRPYKFDKIDLGDFRCLKT